MSYPRSFLGLLLAGFTLVMVPLVAVKAELDLVKGLIDKAAAEVARERGAKPNYIVGTMIKTSIPCCFTNSNTPTGLNRA